MKKQMVEFAGQPVGIVVPENGRLKFVAVKFHVHALDGRVYDTMDELRLAIRAAAVAFYEGGGEREAAAG